MLSGRPAAVPRKEITSCLTFDNTDLLFEQLRMLLNLNRGVSLAPDLLDEAAAGSYEAADQVLRQQELVHGVADVGVVLRVPGERRAPQRGAGRRRGHVRAALAAVARALRTITAVTHSNGGGGGRAIAIEAELADASLLCTPAWHSRPRHSVSAVKRKKGITMANERWYSIA